MKSTLPERRLIPKWRPVEKTLLSPEMRPLKERTVAPSDQDDPAALEKAIREWRKTPTASHLAEVLAFSFFTEHKSQIVDVARAALSKGIEISPSQRSLIDIVTGTADEAASHQVTKGDLHRDRIQGIRRLLRMAPDNPLVLLDYAQLQTAAGKRDVAQRALASTLQLLPNSPIVLRTVARFLVHIGDPERAHTLIRKHARTRTNPWLMASEIALAAAADRSPSFVSQARKLITAKAFPNRHMSELAGAVAGYDLTEGRLKNARDKFQVATNCPNDNVAAQLITDQEELGLSLQRKEVQKAILDANEASTILAWRRGQVTEAKNYAMAWHEEEPFSSRPIQFMTVIQTLEADYANALKLVTQGLQGDPDDVGLLTNLAYLRAVNRDVDGAERAARRVLALGGARSVPYITSTAGLIAMQQGNHLEGDRLYRSAITHFEKGGFKKLAALCRAYYARSAVETGHPDAARLVREALEQVKKTPTSESVLLLSRLGQKVTTGEASASLRHAEQWVYDAEGNTLKHAGKVGSRGAPLVVWQGKKA